MIKPPEKSAVSRGAHLSPADQTRAALIRAALKLFGRVLEEIFGHRNGSPWLRRLFRLGGIDRARRPGIEWRLGQHIVVGGDRVVVAPLGVAGEGSQ